MKKLILIGMVLSLASCKAVTDYCAEGYKPVRAAARVLASTATQFPVPDVCKTGEAVLEAAREGE